MKYKNNFLNLPHNLKILLNSWFPKETFKQKKSNLRQQLKIKWIIHQQRHNKNSNINKYSHTGCTLYFNPTTMLSYWRLYRLQLLLPIGLQPSQNYLPWYLPCTKSPFKIVQKYIQRKKGIIGFALNTWGKYITFLRLCLIESMRNICLILD